MARGGRPPPHGLRKRPGQREAAGAPALARLLTSRRGGLLAALLASAVAAVPALCVPLAVGHAVDALRAGSSHGLHRWVWALVGLAVLTALLWGVRLVLTTRAALGVEADLREAYFSHLIRLDLADIERDDPGQLIARGTSDLRLVRNFLNSGVPGVGQLAAGFGFVIVVTATHHVDLALIAAGPVVGVLLASSLRVRTGRALMRESRERLGEATRELDETLGGMTLVRAYGRRAARLEMVRTAIDASRRATTAVFRRNAIFEAVVATLPMVGVVGVLSIGGYLAIRHGALSDGELITDYMLLLQLAGPTSNLAVVMQMGQSAAAAALRVQEVLGRRPALDVPPPDGAGEAAASGPGAVALRGVHAGYGTADTVLREIDLDLPGGAHVAVSGPTGSGKSLLMGVIKGMRTPRSGEVTLDGTALGTLERSVLGRSVALATAADMLFAGTVREAIAYGRPDASDAQIRDAAEQAAAHEFIAALPHGYDTPLGGRGGVTLSGGQRQRLMIARALAVEPRVLLLDGATASLDALTERRVLDAVRGDAGRTTISSGLRAEQLDEADRVVRLEDGRIAEVRAPSAGRRAASPPSPGPGAPAPSPPPRAAAAAPPASTGPAVEPRAQARAARDERRRRAARRRRVIVDLARPDGRLLALTVAVIVLATAATLAPPLIGAHLIDDVLGPRNLGRLDLLAVLLGASVVVGFFAIWARTFLVPWVGQRFISRLRLRAFKRLLAVHMAYFDLQNPGQIISRLTNNVEMLTGLLQNGLGTMCSAAATLIGTTIAFLVIDPELALVAYACVPFLVLATVALSRGRRWSNQLIVAGIGDLTVFLRETVRGARTMRAYGQEARHRERFAALNRQERLALRRAAYVFGAFAIASELVVGLTVALLVLVAGEQALSGAISVGTMVAFSTYLRLAVSPMSSLVTLEASYGQAGAGLDQIASILELPPDREGTGPAPPPRTGAAALAFEDVWFAYSRERIVLRGLSLAVEPGQTLLVVGETGAGKSTLLRMALRFYRPFRGRVLLDGRDVGDVPDAWLRGQIALVSQEPYLFTGTVLENIRFARPDATRAEVERVVRELGAGAALDRLPRGLDTRVGAGGVVVSSGQRQLIALARALLVDARLLLLDEATSALDPETARVVEEAMARARAGRTTILVAHRLGAARYADRIVLLAGGTIAEQGTHDELLAAGGRYAQLWEAAARDAPA